MVCKTMLILVRALMFFLSTYHSCRCLFFNSSSQYFQCYMHHMFFRNLMDSSQYFGDICHWNIFKCIHLSFIRIQCCSVSLCIDIVSSLLQFSLKKKHNVIVLYIRHWVNISHGSILKLLFYPNFKMNFL